MASLIETVQAFVAIGGRVWIDPANRLGAIVDAEGDAQRETTSRAFFTAKAADPAALATLVREYGQPQGRFIVWQEA